MFHTVNRKKEKENLGVGGIPKSSQNHCLKLADELTWQLTTLIPCALTDYVEGTGKFASLQPSLILWSYCSSIVVQHCFVNAFFPSI